MLLGIAALFLVGCLGLGLFISAVSTTQQNAFFVSLIATLLPTFILSGFIFPIESMPTVVQAFTYLVPARYFLVVVRSIILKGVGIEVFWSQVVFLAGFALRFLPALEFTQIMRVARAGETGETYAFNEDGLMVTGSRFDDELKEIGLLVDDEQTRSPLNVHIRDPGVDMIRGHRPSVRRYRHADFKI